MLFGKKTIPNPSRKMSKTYNETYIKEVKKIQAKQERIKMNQIRARARADAIKHTMPHEPKSVKMLRTSGKIAGKVGAGLGEYLKKKWDNIDPEKIDRHIAGIGTVEKKK